MCGILGLIHNGSYKISNLEFNQINKLNYNRGPDNQGYAELNLGDNFIKFGHSRLAILDLADKANQPMSSFSDRFIISFNGEIYNHLELRNKLNQSFKISWQTNCDTETLINLFEFYSFEKVLNMIEGMFSFILLDKKNSKFYAARDLAGEKPLYFTFQKNYVAFSSDLKTISKFPEFEKDINNLAVQKFLEYSYIPAPLTIYKNVFKLNSSSLISIEFDKFNYGYQKNLNYLNSTNGLELSKWWNLDLNSINNHNIDFTSTKSIVHKKLKHSVRQQLISDVPLGAFLSGGIDSSLIVSLMQESQNNTKTFAIGYEDDIYDESKYANQIAKVLSTDHTSYIFSNKDIINSIDTLPQAFSEPFADSSQLPTMLVSKIAKNDVKVVLTGDGGDELFGGYNRYLYANKYWNYFKLINSNYRKKIIISLLKNIPESFYSSLSYFLNIKINKITINKIENKLLDIFDHKSYYKALTKEWNHNNHIINFDLIKENENVFLEIFKHNVLTIEDKMMISDFLTYLPDDILCKVDRSTMNYSLESRAPFLNKDLVETAFQIPIDYKITKGKSKFILREILKKYVPKNLIDRPKMGFGVPIGNLIKNELRSWTDDILSESSCNKHGFFDFKKIQKIKHFEGKNNNQYKLWSLIQFNQWFDRVY